MLQRIWSPSWFQRAYTSAFTSLSTRWQKVRALLSGYNQSEHYFWATSTAPAETLWQTVNNLADLAAWHPLITGTNAPRGQSAKPGLIYRVFSRYLPVSTKIFVERVRPGELLSVRVFPLPGLQERATYRIVSTLCGTCVLYSITLSGWLSPLVWPMVKPRITQVATSLVHAAEEAAAHPEAFAQRAHLAGLQKDIF
ncbi:MAG: SRPBCC family protein [Cyanobacteria bacterium J06560_2]